MRMRKGDCVTIKETGNYGKEMIIKTVEKNLIFTKECGWIPKKFVNRKENNK